MGALCLAQEPRGRAARGGHRQRSAQALRGVVLPFVFRRYLDYSVFERCARCTARSASHAAAQRGRPERANDVKLSRGGIREIEFTVQLLQVVRGGQFPEIAHPPHAGGAAALAAPG
jgi:glutamate-ammonia-ligase adenylyltransferase